MQAEMDAHIAQAAERFRARGMSASDALVAARREFGPVSVLQETARDARGGQWVDALRADLKYAFRYFARTPLTTITIVLTLALGIGFSSAVFSVLNGILTRPAPGVPDDPALVKIRGLSDVRPYARRLSFSELSAYAGLTSKFSSVVGWGQSGVVVGAGDPSLGVIGARAYFVTPNYFATLGIRLAAGRGFDQSRFDERFPPELTAIVSHGFALERFGDANAAIGKQIRVNDVLVTIIGVTPLRFRGPVQSGEARNLWMPLSSWQLVAAVSDTVFVSPDAQAFEALARLQPGVSVAEAVTAVRLVAAQADADARARTERTSKATADVVHLRGLIDVTGRYDNELGPGIVLGGTLALLILLVCTTTVNSLLVGAAVARRYEIGVRLALGASRWRVVRQLLTEITILAAAGGALGVWMSSAILRVTEVAQDGFDVSPNWATMAFTMSYALLAATLCGLSPALHATRTGLADVLKDSGATSAGRSRLQKTFVVAQIAIAQPLMVLLAAVIASVLGQIPAASEGTVRDRVLITELDTYAGYNLKSPDRIPSLVQRLAQLPGVIAALSVGYAQGWLSLEPPMSSAQATAQPAVRGAGFAVPPGYFRAVDAPIIRGREFVAFDTALPPTAATPLILSESLAVQLFKSRDPIGARLFGVSPSIERRAGERPNEYEVVGVVRMASETNSLEYPSELPPVFVPYRRQREGRILIRTAGPAEPLIPTVTAIVREDARMIPVRKMQTLAQGDRLRKTSRLEAFGTIAGCGVIALALASVGLYAMVSVAVGQRRREIGIRAALGARAAQVVAMFYASGLRVTLFGLALGLPLSVVGLALLKRQGDLADISVAGVAALVTLAVVFVASLASWLPARRAARVHPMTALRSE